MANMGPSHVPSLVCLARYAVALVLLSLVPTNHCVKKSALDRGYSHHHQKRSIGNGEWRRGTLSEQPAHHKVKKRSTLDNLSEPWLDNTLDAETSTVDPWTTDWSSTGAGQDLLNAQGTVKPSSTSTKSSSTPGGARKPPPKATTMPPLMAQHQQLASVEQVLQQQIEQQRQQLEFNQQLWEQQRLFQEQLLQQQQRHHDIRQSASDGDGLDCTSEREVCLPSNYSRFQLPNKGKQTIVSIGEFCIFKALVMYQND